MANIIKTSCIGSWIIPMFSLGFAREYNTLLYINTQRSFKERVFMSTVNGLIYSSPYGLIKLRDLKKRIDIEENINKYHEKYHIESACYNEICGTNYKKYY